MNLKEYLEKKNSLQSQMVSIIDTAKTEERAMSEEEIANFEKLEEEAEAVKKTIEIIKKSMIESSNEVVDPESDESQEEKEERAFASYIRSQLNKEERAEVNLSESEHGVIVPKTIADRIISKVKEISPLYEMSLKFHVKGDLIFPEYDESEGKIRMAYQEEFQSLSSNSGKFKPRKLSSYLAGALTKIPRSLVNNTDFDLVEYVILKMAEAHRDFLEREGLNGTEGKMTGALSAKTIIESASSIAITADELIDLQLSIPQIYRSKAMFIMHTNTLKSLRKLKDNTGQYLFSKSLAEGFNYDILDTPVYESDNMPEIGAGKKPILFIDPTGFAFKVAKDIEIQVLQEKYADEHALGVIAWAEVDSNILEQQKLAVLKMKDNA